MSFKIALCCVLGVLVSAPSFAHHSTSMFAMGEPTTMTGVVKEFQWTNPHCYVRMEVKGPDGAPQEWLVEIHSTSIMLRRGYSRNTFKPGDTITVTGGVMKDRSKMMRLLRGTFADGKKFWGDDSGNNTPINPL